MLRRVSRVWEQSPSKRINNAAVLINSLTTHVLNIRNSLRSYYPLSTSHLLTQTTNTQKINNIAYERKTNTSDFCYIESDHTHVCSLTSNEHIEGVIDLQDLPEVVSIRISNKDNGYLYLTDIDYPDNSINI